MEKADKAMEVHVDLPVVSLRYLPYIIARLSAADCHSEGVGDQGASGSISKSKAEFSVCHFK